jgi:hypothetical protein
MSDGTSSACLEEQSGEGQFACCFPGYPPTGSRSKSEAALSGRILRLCGTALVAEIGLRLLSDRH